MKWFYFLVLTLATSAASAEQYQCVAQRKIDKDPSHSGSFEISLDANQAISIKGEYTVFQEGRTYPQPKVACVGERVLPETRAAYFKKWASYPLTRCPESSVRVSKDRNGEPDMRSIVLINYRGDHRHSSGYQSYFFICKKK